MSKPLIPNKETKKEAADWHRLVFLTWGYVCWLHLAKDPKSKMPATDAAHIIKRSRLGAKWAYASSALGRPLCRECHSIQELGLDPMYFWPYADELACVRAYNALPTKTKLPEPEPRIDAWKRQ